MTFSESIQTCLAKYGTFTGRARRSEYWWFNLFTLLLSLGLLGLGQAASSLNIIVSLVLLVPSIAVGSRRLHDIGRSGWWQLLELTIIGGFFLMYWYAKEGQNESNTYGPHPTR